MSKYINGCFQVDGEDIDRAIKATGAKYHYVFGGFDHVYTSKPLTKRQQERYEKRAQKTLSHFSEQIAKDIDSRILQEILKSDKLHGDCGRAD